jgi:serine-type D-Ala-D-Ala carboxypeptidase (penicillin-binding protein 5/6)
MMLKPWIAAGLIAFGPVPAAAFETQGGTALIVDHATGLVLYAKNADQPLPPASMSKLMTLYMLFEAIRDGKVTLDSQFIVSARAQAMGGSRMFVEAGKSVAVHDLIRGIVIQSGNDACVVVAEGLYGSEEAFADAMTKRARELGLNETALENASGWPEPGHVMSAEDLVALSRLIIEDFPEYYEIFHETEFTFNGIKQQNRNPLLGMGLGADGLKTGHTSEAGYGLVGSAVQDGQRIVFMVGGLDSISSRATEAAEIVKWSFGAFETIRFFAKGETVAEAKVWLGAAPEVPLVAPQAIQMLAPNGARATLKARVVYQGPIEAPIALGQPLGQLVVEADGMAPASFPLVAGAEIARGGLGVRIGAAGRLVLDRALQLIPARD